MSPGDVLRVLIELRKRIEELEAQVRKLQEPKNGRPRKTPVGD
jgi:hypothetical protein